MNRTIVADCARAFLICALGSAFLVGCTTSPTLVDSNDALRTATKADIARLSDALDQYYLDMYEYPASKLGLRALTSLPHAIQPGAKYREGGYIDSVPHDPWGRRFIYEQPGILSGRAFDLYSLGADGTQGGAGENADIGNWE